MKEGTLQMEFKVHPGAAVFPMLSDDELRDLAEDIRANGLIHPIVLDAEGVLIDGRNRLAACNLAGREPRFETLSGQDPVAYILSSNISRRHLSKGQQAMAVVKTLLVSNTSQAEASRQTGINRTRIVQASTVVDYAPELADSVLTGALSLDDAYEQARRRKSAASSLESQMAHLRIESPDLAVLVVEERMALGDALAALAQRQINEKKAKQATTQLVCQTLNFLDPAAKTPAELAGDIVKTLDPTVFTERPDVSRERFKRCLATLEAITDAL